MLNKIAHYLRLAARYAENPRALQLKLSGGIPETYWKLDHLWFHTLQIHAVIDVGANEGQFSRTMRALLPEAKIYAFEPIPECFKRTRQRFIADSNFKILNLALAERKGLAKFTVASGDTGASSLLPVGEAQEHYFPHTLQSREIETAIDTLDNVMATEMLNSPYLLKLDVQGYEFQVLAGGFRTLANAKLVILEASYEPFYEGQKLFHEVYDVLRNSGFQFRDTFNMMYDMESGRAVQGDFLFERVS